jgi:hypothetical protein
MVVALLATTASSACSLITSFNGFTGGAEGPATDASVGSDVGDEPDTSDGAVVNYDGSSCGEGGVCIPTAPEGWTGPVTLFDGPTDAAPPSCPSGVLSIYSGNADVSGAAATCSSCSCGAATGESCTTPQIQPYNSAACVLPIGSPVPLGTCAKWGGNDADSFTITASTTTGGTCAPSGGTATNVPAPTWARQALACEAATAAGACSTGSACLAAPPTSFAEGTYCIVQTGDVACPATVFTDKRTYYGSVDDQRGCTMCTCAAPTGGTCKATARLYDDTACQAVDISNIPVPSSCMPADMDDSAELTAPPTVDTAGSCEVSGGGAPSGSPMPATPTTLCCATL